MENIKLSQEPYKGTRDFYPEDMMIQKYIFSVMRKTVEKYGYQEYDASILEETDLYRAKSGEEIVNEQTYSFKDRGGRDVTIRPEMTPTVARMVARKRKELAFPLRWYSIPNLLRYERPQRGRLREHWQLNVDIFGMETTEAEREMILIARDIMLAFGAREKNFSIKLNSRKVLNYILEDYLHLEKEPGYRISKLIDRKAKISEKEFEKEAEEILKASDKVDLLKKILRIKKIKDLPQELSEAPGVIELGNLYSSLERIGLKNVIFDPSLIRGFDYYTGIIFEFFDNNPVNSRSLFGGGRYDDLVGIFDVEKICGVGFGMGDVTARDFLETYGLLPEYKSTAQIYICKLSDAFTDFVNETAGFLRSSGLNVAVDHTGRKLASQIKTADRQKIPFVICIGEDEMKEGKFKVKNLKSGKENILTKEEIVKFFLES